MAGDKDSCVFRDGFHAGSISAVIQGWSCNELNSLMATEQQSFEQMNVQKMSESGHLDTNCRLRAQRGRVAWVKSFHWTLALPFPAFQLQLCSPPTRAISRLPPWPLPSRSLVPLPSRWLVSP